MTTLVFDWSELLGKDATGVVRVRATRWRHEPDTLVVPWSRDLRFTGREVLDVDAGLVLSVEWRPEGVADSLTQTLVVPAEGEHLAHLLAVDPESLDPVGRDRAAWEWIDARLDALESRPAGESVDLTGYATEAYVDAALADVPTPDPVDLSAYPTRTEMDAALAAIPAPAPSSLLRDPDTGDYYMEA